MTPARTLTSLSFLFVALLATGRLPAQEREPIIDMHLHAHVPPDIPAGAPSICRPQPCGGDGTATATSAETLEKTLEAMDRYNVVKAFVSGAPETLREWQAGAPERFIPSPFILEPGTPTAETLETAYTEGRFEGLGEVATQLVGIAPNDERLDPYFALAEKHDLPVLIHTLGIGPQVPGFRSQAGHPLLLEDVLVRHPDLRIYVENSGYPFLGEMIALMSQYPQVYGDLSTITWILPRSAFYDYLEGLIDAGLGKRLMFGSDQMRWPEKIGAAVEAIEEADFLTEQQKRDIFYNNAARFLELEAESTDSP